MQDSDLRALAMGYVADPAASPELRAASADLLERYTLARQVGMTFDGRRDVWGVLGYPVTITPQMYRERFERGGIAARLVTCLPDAAWRGEGEVVEDEDPKTTTQFEQAFYDLNDRLNVWATLRNVSVLARLGEYAALYVGAPGAVNLELPKGRPEQLAYLRPFAQDSITLGPLDDDIASPRFGLPLSYQFRVAGAAGQRMQTQDVHWTRVISVAEGVIDDPFKGEPALRTVWNDFENLDKVAGGGSEAFWLRANAGLHFDVDAKMEIPDVKNTLEALKAQAEAYKHQMTRWLRTRGVKVESLGSDVADFKNPVDIILALIAGAKGIPRRILTGSEVGELASTQDRDNWEDTVNDYRTGHCYPNVLRPFVDRLIAYGYLPKPKEYSAAWPQKTMSPAERAAGALAWANVNRAQGSTVFTNDEIRETWEEMEPLEVDDVEPTGDTAALAAALERHGNISIVVKKSDAA